MSIANNCLVTLGCIMKSLIFWLENHILHSYCVTRNLSTQWMPGWNGQTWFWSILYFVVNIHNINHMFCMTYFILVHFLPTHKKICIWYITTNTALYCKPNKMSNDCSVGTKPSTYKVEWLSTIWCKPWPHWNRHHSMKSQFWHIYTCIYMIITFINLVKWEMYQIYKISWQLKLTWEVQFYSTKWALG